MIYGGDFYIKSYLDMPDAITDERKREDLDRYLEDLDREIEASPDYVELYPDDSQSKPFYTRDS